MSRSREIVCIHLGQAGCQVGEVLWETMCIEHGINPGGLIADDTSPGMSDEPFNAFFSETSSGQHVPRSVFFDTDPSSKQSILSGTYSKLFHPDNILSMKKDCKNNFFEARSMNAEFLIMDLLMDRIRLTVDLCNNLQGFFVFRSFGGGTGSGIGCELLCLLRDQFKKKKIFEPVIFPSSDFACSIVEPYNAMFALAYSRENADLSLMLDNQAAYTICKSNLKVKCPTFDHLNRIISQMVSAVTTSLRFNTELNASLEEIVTNMVPQQPFRYPVLSLSPIRSPSLARHESFKTKEIITDLFEDKNILCDLGNPQALKQNRYLSVAVLLRGYDEGSIDDDAGSGVSGALGGASGTGSRANGNKKRPIQINDAMDAIKDLLTPKNDHRERLRFLPWLGDRGGFKVGVVGEPPVIPPTGPDGTQFMAQTTRQGALLANTTAVRSLFMRQYIKFLKLFYHKAYVWQFLEANGEMEAFYEAQELVRGLIDDYEGLVRKCYDEEYRKEGEALTIHGKTTKYEANMAAREGVVQ